MKILKFTILVVTLISIGFFLNYILLERTKKIDVKKEKSGPEKNIKVNKNRDTVDFNIIHQDSTMVAFVFGQSNASNHAEYRYTPKQNVYNYYNGILYKADDPLLGCDGDRGSVWGLVGDALIEKGFYKNVVIIPIGIGNTSIEAWAETDLVDYLANHLEQIKKDSIVITHFLWHQGENDNLKNTGKDIYKNRIRKLVSDIREKGFDAPFFVSVNSYAPNPDKGSTSGIDPDIQSAQIEFINETKGVYCGPNTDKLIKAIHRRDAVHFSHYGNQLYAKQWFNAITNPSESTDQDF